MYFAAMGDHPRLSRSSEALLCSICPPIEELIAQQNAEERFVQAQSVFAGTSFLRTKMYRMMLEWDIVSYMIATILAAFCCLLPSVHCPPISVFHKSRACLQLEADRRWAVTGTPIQNSLDDAAGLLAFLRHEPWSDRGWWRKVIGDPYKVVIIKVGDFLDKKTNQLVGIN